MKIDKSRVPARGWVKKALCGSAVLGLAMTMGAQSALANNFESFTPFSRIATLPGVKKADGVTADPVATYARAKRAALHLAEYVASIKDGGAGGDWVLGGTSGTCRKTQNCTEDEISHAILGIPSPERINPSLPKSKENTKKASVLDFCNEHYAKQALGVAPIINGKKVVNGYSHTPALPCEVSVWNDDENIYLDMLDPIGIFTLFFTDVHFSDVMLDDPDFADAIRALPPAVKAEIKAIVDAAMTDFADDEAGLEVGDMNLDMDVPKGPVYDSMAMVVAAVDASPWDSPYKHVGYTRKNGGDFDSDDAMNVAQTIIDTMSIHGNPDAGTHPSKISDDETLDSILSPGSSWRSARPTPLPLPGKNYVIEACSPTYAKLAMGGGRLDHVTALPCEITVQVIDQTGDGSKETLVVSYLDPHFMLGALFADVTDPIELEKFEGIPLTIMEDLQKIVAAALDHKYSGPKVKGVKLNPGVQISYDMLPPPSDD